MVLQFPDSHSLADIRRFLERAERVGATSVRLQAVGRVLIVTVPVLVPRGLGDATPLILAVRTHELAEASRNDAVVAIRSVLERIARLEREATLVLDWPASTLAEGWAGIAPPQAGWVRDQTVPLDVIGQRADAVLAPIANVVTTHPTELLVQVLGAEPNAPLGPAGVAAAAQTFGFLVGSQSATLFTSGRWARLSTPHGHVLWKR